MKPSTQSKQFMPVISKAKWKHCWGIDGKKYLDFTGSNLTNVLGYRKPIAIVPNFPGVSQTELELTKLLSSYTNTKHFRYFKNGHNAVDCAVRLARHILKSKKPVYYMGYHGTSDNYIWTTIDNNGILKQKSWQTGLKFLPEKCDILVFESRYAEYADKIDCKIRICDTLKSGVRALYEDIPINEILPLRIGDVWELKTPYDFVLYGKSIANGSALAVMTGKDDLMEKIGQIYYSTTFGSNPDSMLECIRTIKDFEKVKDKYFELYSYAKEVLPEWQSISPEKQKEFQEQGILFNGYWQVMLPHTKKDIDFLASLCDNLLS